MGVLEIIVFIYIFIYVHILSWGDFFYLLGESEWLDFHTGSDEQENEQIERMKHAFSTERFAYHIYPFEF